MALASESCGIKEMTDGLLEKCDRRKGQGHRGVYVMLEKLLGVGGALCCSLGGLHNTPSSL